MKTLDELVSNKVSPLAKLMAYLDKEVFDDTIYVKDITSGDDCSIGITFDFRCRLSSTGIIKVCILKNDFRKYHIQFLDLGMWDNRILIPFLNKLNAALLKLADD